MFRRTFELQANDIAAMEIMNTALEKWAYVIGCYDDVSYDVIDGKWDRAGRILSIHGRLCFGGTLVRFHFPEIDVVGHQMPDGQETNLTNVTFEVIDPVGKRTWAYSVIVMELEGRHWKVKIMLPRSIPPVNLPRAA